MIKTSNKIKLSFKLIQETEINFKKQVYLENIQKKNCKSTCPYINYNKLRYMYK